MILEAFKQGLVENNFDLLFSYLDEENLINHKLSKDKITLLHKFCQVDENKAADYLQGYYDEFEITSIRKFAP